ncbi:MAG: MaoC/PaaZ C-terminal domain-containing protein [Chloroflexota bacterium]
MIERPRYFEDYVIGDTTNTMGRTITEADVVIHAGHTGDYYPHHVDAAWSAKQAFGQRIAHGTLILSVAAGMLATEINPLAFSYGYDRVRFIRPVFIGNTIRATATIIARRICPKRDTVGLIDEQCVVVNESAETVLAFVHIHLVERRPPAGST